MKYLITIPLIFLLCSCAQKQWFNPRKTTQEFYQDSSQCEAMSYSAGNYQALPGNSAFNNGYNQGAAIGSRIAKKRIYENCMQGKGWSLM